MAYIPGQYSKAVALERQNQKKLKEASERNIARDEKPYASDLHMAGREAYYKEAFEGIKLENQNLPKIGHFESIENTHYFKEGYKRGQFLVEQGLIPEKYAQTEANRTKHR